MLADPNLVLDLNTAANCGGGSVPRELALGTANGQLSHKTDPAQVSDVQALGLDAHPRLLLLALFVILLVPVALCIDMMVNSFVNLLESLVHAIFRREDRKT